MDFLRNMKKVSTPILGCLVAWQSEYGIGMIHIVHMGVITSTNPLLVANRESYGGDFFKDQAFREAGRGCEQFKPVFYIPKVLLK